MILWLIALVWIACAAAVGDWIGASIADHDARRRAQRDAIDTLIAESDAYRAEARRKLWAA